MDESRQPGESPEAQVRRLARAKAEAAREHWGDSPPILAADTVVALADRALGKPRDAAEGIAMLQALGGRSHQVLTAVVLAWDGRLEEALSRTRVWMGAIPRARAEAYWATGEPADKAGAYAIQGLGALFVERIEGSWSGVVGLPLFETAALLAKAGIDPFSERPPP